jgi:glycogen synthase
MAADFSWERTAGEYIEVYRQTLNEESSPKR